MKTLFAKLPVAVIVGFLILNISPAAQACAVCMGDPNSRQAGALNGAVFLMLGFIFSVLGLSVALGITLYRRSQMATVSDMQLAENNGIPTK